METNKTVLRNSVMNFIHKHLEWSVFLVGLILLAMMSPENNGHTWCLFEYAGIGFCPGEGLGHSIAYTFRGDLSSAINAHFAGPAAVLILSFRIIHILKNNFKNSTLENKENT